MLGSIDCRHELRKALASMIHFFPTKKKQCRSYVHLRFDLWWSRVCRGSGRAEAVGVKVPGLLLSVEGREVGSLILS